MRRRLFNVAAVVSLVLCAASAALWIRSARWSDVLAFRLPADLGGLVGSDHGALVIGGCTERSDRGHYFPLGFSTDRSEELFWLHPQLIQWGMLSGDNDPDVSWGFAGFTLTLVHEPTGNGSISIPYWFCIAAFLVMPAWLRRRRRQLRQGLCPTCGYDLRATPDRCPECGTVPAMPRGSSTA